MKLKESKTGIIVDEKTNKRILGIRESNKSPKQICSDRLQQSWEEIIWVPNKELDIDQSKILDSDIIKKDGTVIDNREIHYIYYIGEEKEIAGKKMGNSTVKIFNRKLSEEEVQELKDHFNVDKVTYKKKKLPER